MRFAFEIRFRGPHLRFPCPQTNFQNGTLSHLNLKSATHPVFCELDFGDFGRGQLQIMAHFWLEVDL